MSYDTFMLIFYIALGLSVAFFAAAIILFFKLNIISVIGDLSGSTARKAIEDIREHNTATGNKAYNPSPVNRARGKITDKMTKSGRLEALHPDVNTTVGTERFKTSDLGDQTTVLDSDTQETTVLSAESHPSNETTVLSSQAAVNNDTTVLMSRTEDMIWEIEEDIVFVHTQERID